MRVAVLMGGRSGEHAISLASGREVIGALDALGHDHAALVFHRGGGARFDAAEGTVGEALRALEGWRPDVAFIAMHGPDGEDGRVQGALELLGIPYQGSGVQASAIGLDKVRTKEILRAAGLPVAEDAVLTADDLADPSALLQRLGLPLMLKTEASGSSVGVARAATLAALVEQGHAMLADAPRVLVEQVLTGREFTAAVIARGGRLEPLPIVEIRPRDAAFFDYGAKYTPGATDEICPAPIDDPLRDRLQSLGLAAHRALRCRGYSRTDVMLDGDGEPRILETNTLPGLTHESLLPKAALAAGMTFPQLVAQLLSHALADGRPPRPTPGGSP